MRLGLISCGVRNASFRRICGHHHFREQLKEASQRLEGKTNARVVFCDYRDARDKLGLFDRVLSCEMIEARATLFYRPISRRSTPV